MGKRVSENKRNKAMLPKLFRKTGRMRLLITFMVNNLARKEVGTW